MSGGGLPGLARRARVELRRERLLPLPGRVLVQPGQRVTPATVVATAEQPGAVLAVNVAHVLGLGAEEVPAALRQRVGETVAAGDLLARTRGLWGLFRGECRAPAAGTLMSVSARTGQVLIETPPRPLALHAFLGGEVERVVARRGAVVRCQATHVQGVFGLGGERDGPLHLAVPEPGASLTPAALASVPAGAVVVGGATASLAALGAAREAGVAALILGGLNDRDLAEFIGYDVAVAVTGGERIGLTLILCEGFGAVPLDETTFALLQARAGEAASVDGATQIRAGVQRPEIVVPWPVQQPDCQPAVSEGAPLVAGDRVRLVCSPHLGVRAEIVALPVAPATVASGAVVRVARVRLPDGSETTVPRANLEPV